MRTLVILLFIYSNVFGQIEEIIKYNEDKQQLYELIKLDPFQDSDYKYHLRLDIQNSIILDVWKEGDDIKGCAYNYIYQEEKQVMLNDYREVNTYIFNKEDIDQNSIKDIISKSGSILALDSNEVPFYIFYGCNLNPYPPYFSLEYKDSNAFVLLNNIKIELLANIVEYFLHKRKDFESNLSPGRYRGGVIKWNFFPNTFTGVSSEFSSREEQNFDLIIDYGSNFGVRNNTDFTVEYLKYGWPSVCRISKLKNGSD